MNNHASLVRLLFDYGANSNMRTSYGLTPLHGAVLYHCHETAAVLLACGANAELPLFNGLTALHLAAMKGDIEMVRLLLTHGADINCRSRYAHTPLHWAALKGHVEVVHLLLTHGGTDLDACDATRPHPMTGLLLERINDSYALIKKGEYHDYEFDTCRQCPPGMRHQRQRRAD